MTPKPLASPAPEKMFPLESQEVKTEIACRSEVRDDSDEFVDEWWLSLVGIYVCG